MTHPWQTVPMVMRCYRKISRFGGNDKQRNSSRTLRFPPFVHPPTGHEKNITLLLFPTACSNFTFFIEFSSVLTIFVSYIVRNHGMSEPEETVGCISLMKKHGFKSDM